MKELRMWERHFDRETSTKPGTGLVKVVCCRWRLKKLKSPSKPVRTTWTFVQNLYLIETIYFCTTKWTRDWNTWCQFCGPRQSGDLCTGLVGYSVGGIIDPEFSGLWLWRSLSLCVSTTWVFCIKSTLSTVLLSQACDISDKTKSPFPTYLSVLLCLIKAWLRKRFRPPWPRS